MPSVTEVSTLTDIATRFRSALEARRAVLPPSLAGFPERGLEQACELFAQHLRANGFAGVTIGWGRCPFADKHWWVSTGRFVIDLAARERDPDLPVVLVTRATDWEVEGPIHQRAPRASLSEEAAKLLVTLERS